ncbi:MAG: PAS domain S-box protein [Burkholderiaceae bacterium]|nr:PAS domain S-box protein [Burkholderiaceae bacterium]
MAARSTQPTDSVLLAFDPVARAKDSRFNFSRYAHLLAILLLAGAIAGLAYLLINEDRAMQRDALNRDADTLAQSLSLRLQAMTEAATSIALEIGDAKYNESRFASTGREFMMSKPELLHLAYVDGKSRVRWSVQSPNPLADWSRPAASEIGAEVTRSVIKRARDAHSTFFSPPYEDESGPSSDNGSPFTDLVTPVFSDDRYVGALLARVSLPELLRATVKPELGQRYRIALRGEDGAMLAASTSGEAPSDEPRYGVRVPLLSDGITVQASPFRQRSRVLGNALSGLVVGLTLIVMATLAALARRDVKQAQVERVLRTETAFRRAMEDSLATGMGVLDRNGVLRHVNQAIVQMTGWPASDLIGRSPPFPYWPPERHAEYQAKLAIVLAGQAPASGFELKVLRRDGTLFDARMYFSALLGDDGEQLAWMSSMADITEPKRFSEQLAAAHERFTTVLESLDAAVSVVADDGGNELLFANRSYRDLYGSTSAGHRKWGAALPLNSVAGEIFDPETARWFDVRTRSVRWVDGRDVLLQIATDITERKATEELVRQQQEKVELTSRLMTMGEMASSLAHELNQPLTAISNYSLGAVSRMKDGGVSNEELLPALEKTAGQAQRAGNIIRRIREFVKRSEPHRRPTEVQRIVEDAIGFADIEAAKKGIVIRTDVEANLPPLDVDPILIEQLLLNLLKNAVDAMDQATVKEIDLIVKRQDDMALFSVVDRGSGVSELQHANLFQPFFSTKPEGMGMGLNICRSIVEFHHGRLTVEPNPDGGAIFVFTLPLAEVNEAISESNEELK